VPEGSPASGISYSVVLHPHVHFWDCPTSYITTCQMDGGVFGFIYDDTINYRDF
jgi:hypothetical protein